MANAESCASISIVDKLNQQNKFIYELIGNNMERVSIERRLSKRIKDTKNYYLQPGSHTLTFWKWDKSLLKKSILRNDKRQKPQAKTHVVSVNVKPNKHYTIANVGTNDQPILSVSKMSNMQCDASTAAIFKAKDSKSVTKITLPSALQYRLDMLMEKAGTTSEYKNNLLPLEVVTAFGAVTQYPDKNKTELITLAVSPFSLASKLGLQTGDKIIKLGSNEIKDIESELNEPLADYLLSLSERNNIEIEVVRDNNKLTLNHPYRLTIIPETRYSFNSQSALEKNLINAAPINNVLSRKFKRLLMDIDNLPQLSTAEHLDAIKIVRQESYDKKYGIVGEIKSSTSGFTIHQIKENSAAQAIGIKENDELIRINDTKIKGKSINEVAQVISHIELNKDYNLLVNRDGHQIKLSGIYSPLIIPAYELIIDRNSKLEVEKLMPRLMKKRRKKHLKRGGSYSDLRSVNDMRHGTSNKD